MPCATFGGAIKDACPEHRQACLDACERHGMAVPA